MPADRERPLSRFHRRRADSPLRPAPAVRYAPNAGHSRLPGSFPEADTHRWGGGMAAFDPLPTLAESVTWTGGLTRWPQCLLAR